ncbi:hypothetical protein KSP40_PGU012171 [Platanthera guangdongensis]|uniref:Uncharacterized protein n=1 Tax=Platanthera guangdongensis TaxID=2320717 RepID=A0ABR2MAW1_9ASPA
MPSNCHWWACCFPVRCTGTRNSLTQLFHAFFLPQTREHVQQWRKETVGPSIRETAQIEKHTSTHKNRKEKILRNELEVASLVRDNLYDELKSFGTGSPKGLWQGHDGSPKADDDVEEMEPPPSSGAFSRLFAFREGFYWILIAVEALAPAAHGMEIREAEDDRSMAGKSTQTTRGSTRREANDAPPSPSDAPEHHEVVTPSGDAPAEGEAPEVDIQVEMLSLLRRLASPTVLAGNPAQENAPPPADRSQDL